MEKLQEWMSEKVYGLNGTKDKTLKIRGNPKVFFDTTIPPTTLPYYQHPYLLPPYFHLTSTLLPPYLHLTTTLLLPYSLAPLLPSSLPRSSST